MYFQGGWNNPNYNPYLRALARVGKAYMKLDDLDKSIYYYDKAITEHRDPNIQNERSQVNIGM